MKRTKIIATLGPACETTETIREVLLAGVNGFRFNFSHGTAQEHASRVEAARRAVESTGLAAAFILDTKGPEIRIRLFENGSVTLQEGQEFTLWGAERPGNETGVSVSLARLAESVSPGDAILIDDGLVELCVLRRDGDDTVCRVMNGGVLSDNKSVNVKGVSLAMPALSSKDIDDVRFAVEHGFDFIAASFVRTVGDVNVIRGVLDAYGGEDVRLIAKIENGEGVRNAESILKACDGLMVARGDMGVELPFYSIPVIQKNLIGMCNAAGKVVITATQMLDSMIRSPRPTRAEAADVANAVFDGSDAVMLSGETAAGKYPVLAVSTMTSIVQEAESRYSEFSISRQPAYGGDVTGAISYASCSAASQLGARVILTPTRSGYTPRMIARYRPKARIVATTRDPRVERVLSLTWGVETLLLEKELEPVDDLIERAFDELKASGALEAGDVVVVTAGLSETMRSTNTLRIEHVPD